MCELTLAVSHPPSPPQEKIRWFKRSQHGVRLDLGGVSQLHFLVPRIDLVCFIFIIYFVSLPLCNKYFDYIVTFISIHSVIICVVFL
jgi:hypothetical protein